MQAPDFWGNKGVLSGLLAPAGWIWAMAARRRQKSRQFTNIPVPVICVGNLVAGGAGKTPVALSIASKIGGSHFLSAGYGGSEPGPLRVDPDKHDYRQVGDEPLLLAGTAPCWVARNRVKGAMTAAQNGACCLIMDDGFQDPSLYKDLSMIVVDGHTGFGNGRCLPAGPLREDIADGLRRASCVVLLGDDRHEIPGLCGNLPVLRARLEPDIEASVLAGRRVVGFAGIAYPDKFFRTLVRMEADVVARHDFDDHYGYHVSEIRKLQEQARHSGAVLVTTAKDFVRIPREFQDEIIVLRMKIIWEDETKLQQVLNTVSGSPA